MKRTAILLLALAAIGMKAQQPAYLDKALPIEQRIDDLMGRLTLQEKINIIHAQSKFSSYGVPRLGIPSYYTDDGPHGVRPDTKWDEWSSAGFTNDSCTAFPALTCLAATWNPAMSRIYGESLGEEARYRGKDMILGPGVNIFRTPLNGRNFEYMGEDPKLAAVLVVPYIQGLQSKDVAACVKHYALNNNEAYRHTTNVILSDRALREIYLPAFEAAVKEAGTWGIMGAYNLYKNQHNCHNQYLLNNILKQEWGYDGVVVSDWGGTHDTWEAINNGLDLEFGTYTNGLSEGTVNAYQNYYLATPYLRLIQSKQVGTRELDEKVRRVLRLYFRTSLKKDRAQGFMNSEAHYAVAQQIAEEGIVLLKNEGNLLPIDPAKTKNILVVGENAIKWMTVGGGSSSLKVAHEVTPLEGLQARLGRSVNVDYARGYVGDTNNSYGGYWGGADLKCATPADSLILEAVEKARTADFVVFVGGRNKSYHQDMEDGDLLNYDLPYAQNQLMEALLKVNKRIVFVSISGNPAALPWADKVPAIVQGWYLGSVAGTALAAVLAGDANPSGKLPFTWAAQLDDVPAHKLQTYPGKGREGSYIIDQEYKEGIFVGYRWNDREKVRPLFAFGSGLSYTTFRLGKPAADKTVIAAGDSIRFTIDVTNTGNRAGAEVVQLYLHDVESSVERPYKELKGFQKVYLEPGQTKTVSIAVGQRDLSFFDEETQRWTAEAGEFEALLGTASDKIAGKVKFTLKE